jgi:hypothetical protein
MSRLNVASEFAGIERLAVPVTCIREVPFSDFGRATGSPGWCFLWFYPVSPGQCLLTYHDRLL